MADNESSSTGTSTALAPQEATGMPSASTQAVDAGLAKLPMSIGEQGLQLRNLDEAWRFAKIVASSELAPRGLKTPEQVLVAMQFGMEVGLPPLAAIQNVAVINGRPSLWGDVMLGLCIASGKFDHDAFEEGVETDQDGELLKAWCVVRRLPNGKPKRGEFTWKEAVRAGLTTKEGPWKTYPRRQMKFRARGFALRDAFPDILKGVVSAEEAYDIPPAEERNITPVARPTSIDALTEKINGGTSATKPAEVQVQTSAPAAAEASSDLPGGNDLPGEGGPELGADPIEAIKTALENCKLVSDVSRASQAWLGQNSRLTNQQKIDVNALCQSRIGAIKAEKRR